MSTSYFHFDIVSVDPVIMFCAFREEEKEEEW